MPWLVVLGKGSWRPARDVFYGPGVHEIDEETAERARAARIRMLVVLDVEPDVLAEDHEPLSLEDLRRGNPPGVQLRQPETAPEPEPIGPLREYRCLRCPEEFPSAGALARHVALNHGEVTSPV